MGHVTSGSGHRKFQADGFLFDGVYIHSIYLLIYVSPTCLQVLSHCVPFRPHYFGPYVSKMDLLSYISGL